MLENSQWYVPSENLISYFASGTNLTSVTPAADQTLWHITNSVNGVFQGFSSATFTIGPIVMSSSNTVMNGIISSNGQVQIQFTGTNGGVTIGIGQERTLDGTNFLEMQMISGSGSSYVTHWAYMAPYSNSVPPMTLPTNQALLSPQWSWMQGTTWNIQNQSLFGTNANGTFSIANYSNGYFWGSGTGPSGGTIGEFTLIGSATPEGNILFNLLNSSNNTLTSLAGLISGDSTDGMMTLNTYAFGSPETYTGSAQVVPEPSTYALFGLGAVGMLTVMRRKKTA